MPGVKGKSGGHNRKTTAELKTEGTFRPDRHGRRVDAQIPPANLPCPAELSEVGQEAWKTIVKTLPREVVTELDRHALLTYCLYWQQFREVWPLYVADATDKGLEKTVFGLSDRLDKLGRQFGWTPQSRAALQMPPKDESDADPMLEFLKRRERRESN